MEVQTPCDKMELEKGGIELDSNAEETAENEREAGTVGRRKLEKKRQVHKEKCYFNLF